MVKVLYHHTTTHPFHPITLSFHNTPYECQVVQSIKVEIQSNHKAQLYKIHYLLLTIGTFINYQ